MELGCPAAVSPVWSALGGIALMRPMPLAGQGMGCMAVRCPPLANAVRGTRKTGGGMQRHDLGLVRFVGGNLTVGGARQTKP